METATSDELGNAVSKERLEEGVRRGSGSSSAANDLPVPAWPPPRRRASPRTDERPRERSYREAFRRAGPAAAEIKAATCWSVRLLFGRALVAFRPPERREPFRPSRASPPPSPARSEALDAGRANGPSIPATWSVLPTLARPRKGLGRGPSSRLLAHKQLVRSPWGPRATDDRALRLGRTRRPLGPG